MPESLPEVQLKEEPKHRSKGTRNGHRRRRSKRKRHEDINELTFDDNVKPRALTQVNSEVTVEVTEVEDNGVDINKICDEDIVKDEEEYEIGDEYIDFENRDEIVSKFKLSHLEEELKNQIIDILHEHREVLNEDGDSVGYDDRIEEVSSKIRLVLTQGNSDVKVEVTEGLSAEDNGVDINNMCNEDIAKYLGQEIVDLDDRTKLFSLFNLSHLEPAQRKGIEEDKFMQDKPRPFSPKDRRVLDLWSKILLALGKIEPSLATNDDINKRSGQSEKNEEEVGPRRSSRLKKPPDKYSPNKKC